MARYAVTALWLAGVMVCLAANACRHDPSTVPITVEHPPPIVATVESAPAWSPDGSTIAYCRHATFLGDSSGIVLMKADGSSRRHIVDGDLPAWSPDGTELAFVRGAQICVVNSREGTVRQLTHACRNFYPSWSPDGRRLAFSRSTPIDSAGIWLCDAEDGGRMTRVFDHGFDPSWCPDGKRIVFSRYTGVGSYDLYVLRLDTGEVQQLTMTLEEPEVGPVWSRDGLWIVYGTKHGIGVYSVTDGTYGIISGTWQPGLNDWQYPDLGPDSRSILYNKAYLWTVKIDGAENRPVPVAPK